MFKIKLLYLFLISLILGGCGYHVGEIKPTPMRGVKSIAVNNFKNETLIPRLESQTADSVVKCFQKDSTYQIDSADRADAILDGTIQSVDRVPMRLLAYNTLQASEYELTLKVKYCVRERVTGSVLMQGTAVGSTPFFIDGDAINSDLVTSQNINYPIAAQRMAEVMVSKISEGW